MRARLLTTTLLFACIAIVAGSILKVGVAAQFPEDQPPAPRLTLFPSVSEYDVSKGQRLEFEISIRNDGEIPVPVSIEPSEYFSPQQKLPDAVIQQLPDVKTWVVVSPQNLILDLGETDSTKVSLKIPTELEPGSYVITILFKPVLPDEFFLPESTKFIGYIGAVVGLNVDLDKAPKDPSKVTVSVDTQDVYTTPNIAFQGEVQNKDVYYHKVKGEIKVFDIFNRLISQVPVDVATVLPGRAAPIDTIWQADFLSGPFRAEMVLGAEDNTLSTSTSFWVVPIQFIILVIILVIASAIAVLARKRFKRAAGVLFGKNTQKPPKPVDEQL